jgi:hypothetical protein
MSRFLLRDGFLQDLLGPSEANCVQVLDKIEYQPLQRYISKSQATGYLYQLNIKLWNLIDFGGGFG